MVDESARGAPETGSGEAAAAPYARRRYVRTVDSTAVVLADDTVVSLSRVQQAILTRLVFTAPHPQSWAGLAEAVWPDGAPTSARAAIQNQVSRLRAAAGDDVITTSGDGYVLGIDTDIELLRSITVAAQRALAIAPPVSELPGVIDPATGDAASGQATAAALAEAAFGALDRLLTMTSPDDLTGIDGTDDMSLYRRHARTVIAAAHTVRLTAALRAGRWPWALIEAERRHSSSPLDEQIAADYARALALAGRRTEALSLVAEVRRELRLHGGLDSGPYLDLAEQEILHDHIAAAADRREHDRTAVAPLVGRSSELRAILQAVAQRHPVQVHGEHGAGVSRILFETRARLTALGVRAILVRAEENPHSATSLIEELLAELGTSTEPADSPITAFESASAALTAQTPTVFLIDDVHFLGPTAWQAIRAAAAADFGGLVLGGHRSAVKLDGQVDVLLGPLDDESVAVMAGQQRPADPERTAEIVAASGGNPLAVRLIVNGIHRAEAHHDAAVGAGVFGSGLDAFIDQLIGDRDGDRLHDLHLAAVAGDGYPVAAFAHLNWPHQPEPPADLIETGGGMLRFRHGAVQHRIYRMVPRGVQLDMHYALGMAARASGAAAGIVARHLVAAAELDPHAAIEAAIAAARAATELGANADAADWLRQARAINEQYRAEPLTDTARIRLDVEYGDALRLVGHPDHMTVLTAAARDALAAGDDDLIAAAGFALLQLGGSSQAGYRDDELAALVYDVVDAIGNAEIRAPVQAAASLAWSLTGHAEQARALFDAAEAAARHPESRRIVLPFAYLALGLPGDLPRRRALTAELRELAEETGDPAAMWEADQLRLSSAVQLGDGATACAALADMEALVDRTGSIGRRWCTLYCAATIAHLGGDPIRAEELATLAYQTFVRVSPERAAAAYYSQLLVLRMEQGRLAELRPVVSRLVVEQPSVTGWHAAAALIVAMGEPDAAEHAAARRHAATALDLAQPDFTWLVAHVVGGRAAALLGDRGLAERYLERLQPWADLVSWQGTCSYGPVSSVLAMLYRALGDETRAAAAARRAAELDASLAATGP